MKIVFCITLLMALPVCAQSVTAPATNETDESVEVQASTPDVGSEEIAPLSYFVGYGARTDRLYRLATGTSLGAEYRLAREVSLQFQGLFGFRGRDDFGNGPGWQTKDDLWAIFNFGAKWSPLMFEVQRHSADVFFTGGLLSATSTGGAMEVGTDYYVGTGATLYFEPNLKGLIDLRGNFGHQGYDQLTVGMNFQFR